MTERVAEALRERFRGFEFGPVEMVQNSRLTRPQPIEPHPRTGAARYDTAGHEHTEFRGGYPDPMYEVRVPREPGKGICIAEAQLKDIGVFRVGLLPGRVF